MCKQCFSFIYYEILLAKIGWEDTYNKISSVIFKSLKSNVILINKLLYQLSIIITIIIIIIINI